ncbi:hypothetical protein PHET_07119 [Paragonimus heterotremus]|uniref:Uncharacterized protein n=1 Tax=Paragonimus heterotremus TaxID=100268 RepID=A0A8J4TDL5_9TREM|nr:hypothetical protein PHET_07119 [Paragonimus heterotremus]
MTLTDGADFRVKITQVPDRRVHTRCMRSRPGTADAQVTSVSETAALATAQKCVPMGNGPGCHAARQLRARIRISDVFTIHTQFFPSSTGCLPTTGVSITSKYSLGQLNVRRLMTNPQKPLSYKHQWQLSSFSKCSLAVTFVQFVQTNLRYIRDLVDFRYECGCVICARWVLKTSMHNFVQDCTQADKH